MEIDQVRIEQAIIRNAVEELLGGDHDIEFCIREEVKKRVHEALGKTLNASIEAALNDAMAKTLDEEVHPVNIWGEREGTPTTIRAALHERARHFWNEKVDKDGKASTYGGVPRWEHVLSIMTTRAFKSEVEQNIVNIAGAIKDSIRTSFYAEVDAKLNDFFKVKSATDQARAKK